MLVVHTFGGKAGRPARAARDLARDVLGGPGQARVVLILAAVIGLSEVAASTTSATASDLERTFHIGNAEFGLVATVASLVAAVCMLPFGVLADRIWRTRLLAVSVTLWAAAIIAVGAATSYLWLLLATVGLGIVTGAATPSVASLTGDFFPAADRGRLYGLILGGQVVGAGVGLVVSGDISAVASWRYAFWWLAVPCLALAWVVWRLPEPPRGGQSRPVQSDAAADDPRAPAAGLPARPDVNLAYEAARLVGATPRPRQVLRADPTGNSLWWAIRYVLGVRTNLVIIVASSLGYFYFAGLRSFAVLYATQHYGVSKPVATAMIAVVGVGGVAGVLIGGRVTDRRLRRGDIRARVLGPAVCLFVASPVLALAITIRSLPLALPPLIVGALLLLAPNPPMDAARLDIMHPRLWGRSEAVRNVFLTAAEGVAPTVFGVLSQYGFGGPGGAGAVAGGAGAVARGAGAGLEYTFLVMLVLLFAAGVLALAALRTYPRDVATARASVEATGATGVTGDTDPEAAVGGDLGAAGDAGVDGGRSAPR